MSKAQVLFTCSEEFKDALGRYAQKHNVSVAIVIREVVAQKIGYDLSSETVTDKRRKYANRQEYLEAQSKRAKEARRNVALLLAWHEKEQRLHDAQIIEESLKKKGAL